MGQDDSILDSAEMLRARVLLSPRRRPERMWPALAAATALALASIGFAVAMIVAPPVSTAHIPDGKPS